MKKQVKKLLNKSCKEPGSLSVFESDTNYINSVPNLANSIIEEGKTDYSDATNADDLDWE